ncbi:hypothetical protein KFE25_011850 [Diacronema lutheri]|uniref:PH domain-containing protein n=1 Tax=Diacronema lutheri TaxID=2081491 RepID=A0A8J6C4N2_DIALT|nr:hypothetical protein KFE25_011850 [Diacronema lutheri]
MFGAESITSSSLCAFMERMFKPARAPAKLSVATSVTDAEFALFSPTGRRPSTARLSSGDAASDGTPSAAAIHPLLPELAAHQPARRASPAKAPGTRSRNAPKAVLQGSILKRNRWNAWQPRWATLDDDGVLAVARVEGEEPTLVLNAAELSVEVTSAGAADADVELLDGAAAGSGAGRGVARPASSAIHILAPHGKKLKILAPEHQLADWAHALGTRRPAYSAASAA